MGVFAGENGLSCLSFGDHMEDLSNKPCRCGGVMGQIIGFEIACENIKKAKKSDKRD